MICAPSCMCWLGTLPCPRHGVEPREHHECLKDGELRGGSTDDCLLCSDARIEALKKAGHFGGDDA
jgi:hypothetical protein